MNVPYRLLVVETNHIFETFGRDGLSFEYETATSIATARERLQTGQYDLILLDESIDATAVPELRQIAGHLPLVLAISPGNEAAAMEGLRQGAYNYLVKTPAGSYPETLPFHIEKNIHCWKNEGHHTLVEDATQGMLIFQNGHIVYANSALVRLTGYPRDQLHCLSVAEIGQAVHPADRKRVLQNITGLQSGHIAEVTDTFRFTHRNGSTRWVETTAKVTELHGSPAIQAVYIDITGRKQAEEALARSALILDSTSDIIILTDPEGYITYWNKGAEAVHGYRQSEVLGQHISLLYAEADLPMLEDLIVRLRAGETITNLELNSLDKQGQEKHVLLSLMGLKDEAGEVTTLVGITKDITERQNTEKALHESQELFSKAFHHHAAPMGIFNLETLERIDVNAGYEAFTGYSRDELLDPATPVLTMWENEAARQQGEQGIAQLKAQGALHNYPLKFRRKDGQIKDVLANAARLDVGDGNLAILSFTDITAQKEAEEAYRQSETRFRATFDHAGIGMTIFDPEGRLLSYNDYFLRMLGYSQNALLGLNFTHITHPDDFDNNQALTEALFTGHKDSYQIEKRYLHKNGHVVWGRLTASVVRKANGEPAFGIGMVEDISEQKKTEDALRQSEARYRAIAEQFPNGMLALYDHDLRYTLASGEGLKNSGLTSADLEGKRLRDVFPPEVYERDEPALLAALQGETVTTLVPYGSAFFRVITAPIRDDSDHIIGGLVMTQNITELKDAETRLEDTVAKLELAIRTARLGIWQLYPDTGHLEWNAQLLQIYGLSREEFGTNADGWRELVHPDDLQAADAELGQIFEGKSVYDVNFRIIRPDGELRYINASGGPVFNEAGEVVSLIGINIDVTHIRQNEIALAQSEAHYRAIAEHFPNGMIALYDHDLRYTIVNGEGLAQIGLHPADLEGKRLRDVFPPEVYERDEPALLAALQGEKVESLVTMGDQHFRVLTLPVYNNQGEIINGMVMSQNITELRNTELALKQTLKQLQLAIDTAELGIWRYMPADDSLNWNDHLLAIYQFSREEFAEMSTDTWREYVHPEDIDWLGQQVHKAIRGRPTLPLEFRIIRRNGEIRYIRANSSPVYDDTGKIIEIAGINIDVTDMREQELALRESEARLRDLAENAPGIVFQFQIDAAGTISFPYMSRNVEALCGYTAAEVMREATPFINTIHPDDQAQYYEAVAKSQTSLQPYHLVHRLITRSGQTIWLNVRSTPRQMPDGSTIWTGIGIDVTEQKETERRLAESEERFTRAFHNQPIAMEIIDINRGQRIEVNDRFCELTEYSRAELTELNIFEIPLWTDPAGQQKTLSQIQTNKLVYNQVGSLTTKSGQLRHILASATRFSSGEGNLAIVSLIDVTDRVQAEEQLLQRNQALEQSPVAVLITDTAGVIEYVNTKFSQMTGYSANEAIGQNPRFLKSETHPAEFYQSMWDTITHGDIWHGELCNKRKDGSLYWELASISSVKDKQGQITHFVSVKEDITLRRQREEEHVRQERLAAVGQLAAGVAHDFNNLLTSIMGIAELLQYTPDMSSIVKGDLAKIVQQSQRAAKLTRQILDFSRQTINEPYPLELKTYLNEALKFIERTIPENVQIQFNFERGDHVINADPAQLQQVITNLAVNARDAMPQGGRLSFDLNHLTLAANDPPPCAEMGPGEWVSLSVSDTGSGINAEALPHIFEPFFTTKEVGQGTGLGLAQVYGIIKQHDGCISVQTEVGWGTIFTLYFPAYAAPVSNRRQPVQPPLMGQGETILLVEDDQAVLEVMRGLLKRLNYAVLAARNGSEGLKTHQQHRDEIDLVLTDAVMPGMDGFALAAALEKTTPSLPVLIISGYARDLAAARQPSANVVAQLQKPMSIHQLAQALRDALSD